MAAEERQQVIRRRRRGRLHSPKRRVQTNQKPKRRPLTADSTRKIRPRSSAVVRLRQLTAEERHVNRWIAIQSPESSSLQHPVVLPETTDDRCEEQNVSFGPPGSLQKCSSSQLDILKCIMTRETTIGEIQELVSSGNFGWVTKQGELSRHAIRLLNRLRATTLELVEAVTVWREKNGDQSSDKPFHWRGENYLLKAMNDTDFLNNVPVLPKMLQFSLQSNPFMVSINLKSQHLLVCACKNDLNLLKTFSEGIKFMKKTTLDNLEGKWSVWPQYRIAQSMMVMVKEGLNAEAQSILSRRQSPTKKKVESDNPNDGWVSIKPVNFDSLKTTGTTSEPRHKPKKVTDAAVNTEHSVSPKESSGARKNNNNSEEADEKHVKNKSQVLVNRRAKLGLPAKRRQPQQQRHTAKTKKENALTKHASEYDKIDVLLSSVTKMTADLSDSLGKMVTPIVFDDKKEHKAQSRTRDKKSLGKKYYASSKIESVPPLKMPLVKVDSSGAKSGRVSLPSLQDKFSGFFCLVTPRDDLRLPSAKKLPVEGFFPLKAGSVVVASKKDLIQERKDKQKHLCRRLSAKKIQRSWSSKQKRRRVFIAAARTIQRAWRLFQLHHSKNAQTQITVKKVEAVWLTRKAREQAAKDRKILTLRRRHTARKIERCWIKTRKSRREKDSVKRAATVWLSKKAKREKAKERQVLVLRNKNCARKIERRWIERKDNQMMFAELQHKNCARKIQRLWLSRKDKAQLDRQQQEKALIMRRKQSARKIERIWVGTKILRYEKKLAVGKLEAMWLTGKAKRRKLEEILHLRRKHSVRKIQRSWKHRALVEGKKKKAMSLQKKNCVRKIERSWLSMKNKTMSEEEKKAIQRQQLAANRRRSAGMIENAWMRNLRRKQNEMERKVSRIQHLWRYSRTKKLEKAESSALQSHRAAVSIQRSWRAFRAKLHRSAFKIQNALLRYLKNKIWEGEKCVEGYTWKVSLWYNLGRLCMHASLVTAEKKVCYAEFDSFTTEHLLLNLDSAVEVDLTMQDVLACTSFVKHVSNDYENAVEAYYINVDHACDLIAKRLSKNDAASFAYHGTDDAKAEVEGAGYISEKDSNLVYDNSTPLPENPPEYSTSLENAYDKAMSLSGVLEYDAQYTDRSHPSQNSTVIDGEEALPIKLDGCYDNLFSEKNYANSTLNLDENKEVAYDDSVTNEDVGFEKVPHYDNGVSYDARDKNYLPEHEGRAGTVESHGFIDNAQGAAFESSGSSSEAAYEESDDESQYVPSSRTAADGVVYGNNIHTYDGEVEGINHGPENMEQLSSSATGAAEYQEANQIAQESVSPKAASLGYGDNTRFITEETFESTDNNFQQQSSDSSEAEYEDSDNESHYIPNDQAATENLNYNEIAQNMDTGGANNSETFYQQYSHDTEAEYTTASGQEAIDIGSADTEATYEFTDNTGNFQLQSSDSSEAAYEESDDEYQRSLNATERAVSNEHEQAVVDEAEGANKDPETFHQQYIHNAEAEYKAPGQEALDIGSAGPETTSLGYDVSAPPVAGETYEFTNNTGNFQSQSSDSSEAAYEESDNESQGVPSSRPTYSDQTTERDRNFEVQSSESSEAEYEESDADSQYPPSSFRSGDETVDDTFRGNYDQYYNEGNYDGQDDSFATESNNESWVNYFKDAGNDSSYPSNYDHNEYYSESGEYEVGSNAQWHSNTEQGDSNLEEKNNEADCDYDMNFDNHY